MVLHFLRVNWCTTLSWLRGITLAMQMIRSSLVSIITIIHSWENGENPKTYLSSSISFLKSLIRLSISMEYIWSFKNRKIPITLRPYLVSQFKSPLQGQEHLCGIPVLMPRVMSFKVQKLMEAVLSDDDKKLAKQRYVWKRMGSESSFSLAILSVFRTFSWST